MSMRKEAFFALVSGGLLLSGCVAPAESAAPAPPPVVQSQPAPEPPVEAHAEPQEPAYAVPVDLPALSERVILRKNIAEGPSVITVEADEIPETPTKISDEAAAERLFGNSGITLQWITWDQRGPVFIAVDEDGVWWLTAEQKGEGGSGLKLEGHISEIGADYFLFQGEIKIIGSPGRERFCRGNKEWRFAITQNRKYWRLREFEWCDRLTDYIDIYF